jgi:hypothetical protein
MRYKTLAVKLAQAMDNKNVGVIDNKSKSNK